MWAEGVPRGPVAHYLALLARTLGRLDEAAAHFEDALASTARAGAPPFLARTQYEYALLLRARGAPGDAERAASLLAEARATAAAIGMGAGSSPRSPRWRSRDRRRPRRLERRSSGARASSGPSPTRAG